MKEPISSSYFHVHPSFVDLQGREDIQVQTPFSLLNILPYQSSGRLLQAYHLCEERKRRMKVRVWVSTEAWPGILCLPACHTCAGKPHKITLRGTSYSTLSELKARTLENSFPETPFINVQLKNKQKIKQKTQMVTP